MQGVGGKVSKQLWQRIGPRTVPSFNLADLPLPVTETERDIAKVKRPAGGLSVHSTGVTAELSCK